MANKQAKQELEQDPLLETFSKAQSFYDRNKSAVIGGIVAFIVIVGGSLGYYYYSSAQEEEAQELMGYATQYYLNEDYETALTGSEADFTVGFEQIIDNYSMTDAANLATYYAAVCEYNLGNAQQAIAYIEDYDVPEGIMGVGPVSFHAVLLTELGEFEEAARKYVQAAELDENESTTSYNYLEAANAYYTAGNQEEAQTYAQLVVDQYSTSSHAEEAQRLLGMLATASS